MSNNNELIRFTNVYKEYNKFSLNNINIKIRSGEFIFVCGKTGSGKTTFLNLITRDILPTLGKIEFEGGDIASITSKNMPLYRRIFGRVPQGDGLFLPNKSIKKNIEFAMFVTGYPEKFLEQRAEKALSMVGILHKKDYLPSELSAGERKTAEIARCMINNPKVIIADEPTSGMDDDTSWDIINLLNDINSMGVTVMVSTHHKELVNMMRKRVVTFSDGNMIGDEMRGRYMDFS